MTLHSEDTVAALTQLMLWEFGAAELDPKKILHSLSQEEFSKVAEHVRGHSHAEDFAVSVMVLIEHMYRTGLLEEDWTWEYTGPSWISLRYTTHLAVAPTTLDLLLNTREVAA